MLKEISRKPDQPVFFGFKMELFPVWPHQTQALGLLETAEDSALGFSKTRREPGDELATEWKSLQFTI